MSKIDASDEQHVGSGKAGGRRLGRGATGRKEGRQGGLRFGRMTRLRRKERTETGRSATREMSKFEKL